MIKTTLSKKDAPQEVTSVETIMPEDDYIVSQTDLRGVITYSNNIFQKISGYTPEELIGSNHNLIRHPDMPRITFALCWEKIKEGEEFLGFIKNLRKDGGFYWVFAYITPEIDEEGELTGYTSFRRKPSSKSLHVIEPLYKELLEMEADGGLAMAREYINSFLESQQLSYTEFVLHLQNEEEVALS